MSVHILVESGDDPHTFDPAPREMALLSRADVYFRIGVPFEDTLVAKLSRSIGELNVVDMHRGIDRRMVEASEGADGHGPTRIGRPDPHCWLDPRLARAMVINVRDELARLDPQNASVYEHNARRAVSDLAAVDRSLAETLAPLKGRDILVFHPAFGYFTDRYGLRQVAIETEGKSPTSRQLAHVIEQAKRMGAKVIFVQPQFSSRAAEAIAREIDGAVVPMDPLAPDYIGNLQRMAEIIREQLEQAATARAGGDDG